MNAPAPSPRRPISGSSWATRLVAVLGLALAAHTAWQTRLAALGWSSSSRTVLSFAAMQPWHRGGGGVDLGWHAPNQTAINNLTAVLAGQGVYGFIFNSSATPDGQYGVYNWCNMPHVRAQEYVRPPDEYELVYVELVHRHHKRTPYAANGFPVEPTPWDCNDDAALYLFAQSPQPGAAAAAQAFWQGYTSAENPFHSGATGLRGSCQFPQITGGGLADSQRHGADLYGVYGELLGFLPGRADAAEWRARVAYRVTQNPITSQVAAAVAAGMMGPAAVAAGVAVPLRVQAAGADSLEPQYACPAAAALSARINSSPAWTGHLAAAAGLFAALDAASGVSPSDAGFHASFDHYYDNLSARQCHGRTLPCGGPGDGDGDGDGCLPQALADAAYRLGTWEYSFLYRDDARSLAVSVGAWGVWIAELAAHLRAAAAGAAATRWLHNVAHDGSLSRLLSILQADVMVWPGMGSEVVFELWRKRDASMYVRVLFGGRVLGSSNPSLRRLDLVPLDTLLAYFDGLIGPAASLLPAKCNGSLPLLAGFVVEQQIAER